jgi:hypothetical protein
MTRESFCHTKLINDPVLKIVELSALGEEGQDSFTLFVFGVSVALLSGAINAVVSWFPLFIFNTVFFLDHQIAVVIRYRAVTLVTLDFA